MRTTFALICGVMLSLSACSPTTKEGEDAPMSAEEIITTYGKSLIIAPERARELSEAIGEKVDREQRLIEEFEN